MVAPNSASPRAGGLGSSAQFEVASYEALAGDGRPPTARAHGLAGRGVLPSRWSRPKKREWGMTSANGTGLGARGTGSPADLVVATYGGLAGGDSPQQRGP